MFLRHDSGNEQQSLGIIPSIEPSGGAYGCVAAIKYTKCILDSINSFKGGQRRAFHSLQPWEPGREDFSGPFSADTVVRAWHFLSAQPAHDQQLKSILKNTMYCDRALMAPLHPDRLWTGPLDLITKHAATLDKSSP
jgi:hypothetical protein